MRELLAELQESTEKAVGKREEPLETIERDLKIHTTIEEETFYPALDVSACEEPPGSREAPATR